MGAVSAPRVADLPRSHVVSAQVTRDGGITACALPVTSTFTVEFCEEDGHCVAAPLSDSGRVNVDARDGVSLVVTSSLVGYDAGLLLADTFTDEFDVNSLGAVHSVAQTLRLGDCSASYTITLSAR